MRHALLFLLFFLLSPAAFARDIGEGYAKPTFKELSQTMAIMGGVDITNTKVADEYARIIYCDLYKAHFKNDLEWDKIRTTIISRIIEKKEYYRVLYETFGVFKLGRYDASNQYFPVTPDTAMKNVGTVVLLSPEEFEPYCGLTRPVEYFPAGINLVLSKPLTLDKLMIPAHRVQNLLNKLAEAKNAERYVYGRIRFRVVDVPGLLRRNDEVVGAELRAEIMGIDFFFDKDMTRPIGVAQAG